MDECDGLVLCGGPDVEPSRYGQSAGNLPCSIDPQRDALEFDLITLALERSMPILGICRGMQILNVHAGGTLTIDIPSQIHGAGIHASSDGDVQHSVEIAADTVLRKVTRVVEAEVNSAHHQAVDVVASRFTISAVSNDGIPEAMETVPEQGTSFIMAVQWHPERMDYAHPLSKNILHTFVFECDSYMHLVRPSMQRTLE